PEAEIGAFGVNTIIFFVIFFLLGFFLFATLFAAVGAVTNSDHEAQQLAAPITYILIIPFILAFLTAQNPNGLISTILSFVPFFTPTVMFMRINITSPPLYQILASILLLIITIMFIIWVTAKIFRVGILMYGKRPSLKEIVKWIKYR
ncbi:MAG: ABC transporter permease, partial [Candidatus Aminicenantia bacterium]